MPFSAAVARSMGRSFILLHRIALFSVGWTYIMSPGSMCMDPRVKMLASTVPPSWADFIMVTTRQGSEGLSARSISEK